MQWIVASLRRSDFIRLISLASHHPRSKTVFPSIHSPPTSPCENQRSLPFSQIATSSSHRFAVFKSGKLSSFKVTVRAAATIANKPRTDSSFSPAESTPSSVHTLRTVRTRGTTKSIRSPSRTVAVPKEDAPAASRAVQVGSKAANARDDYGHIAYSDSRRKYGNEDSPLVSSRAEGHGDRRSFAQEAIRRTARNKSAGDPSTVDEIVGGPGNVDLENVSTRNSKAITSLKYGKVKRKVLSYKSLLDASAATYELGCSSGDQVPTGEKSFGLSSKTGNVPEIPVTSKAGNVRSFGVRGKLHKVIERPVDPVCLSEHLPAGVIESNVSSNAPNIRSFGVRSKAHRESVDSSHLSEQVPAGKGSLGLRHRKAGSATIQRPVSSKGGNVTSHGVCNSKARDVIERPVDSMYLSELSEAEVAPEGVDKGVQSVENKHKKPFIQIAFPVVVFAEWWFNCFLRGSTPYTRLLSPINKLYFWLGAYQRAFLDTTGCYADNNGTADVSKRLENLKIAVTNELFRWGDTQNIYLPSPSGFTRESPSLLFDVDNSFSFQDRVVQEFLYLALEPVFEARFSTRSHASRPGRDVHTALRAAQRSFLGCTWFISGDLSNLQEHHYATQLVDSVLTVVRDSRIAFLLKTGFLPCKSRELQSQAMHSSFARATQGSCGRLKHLLYNVLLDPLDWWMDEKIINLTKQERPSDQGLTKLSFMPAKTSVKRPHKLEYIRYGTKFWVGCDGTKEEIGLVLKDIISFLHKRFGTSFQSSLSVSHISDGVDILDHVIREKVVRPIFKRRIASCGRLFEKRALRIRLCIKASKDRCSKFLEQVGTPASVQHIDEVLSVLNYWYCYAENKEKVMDYCKLTLCNIYSKGTHEKCEEGSTEINFAEQFKNAVQAVAGPETEDKHPVGSQVFIRIPEHERVLRDHAWLQSRALIITEVRDRLKNMGTSPQQSVSHILWRYRRSGNGDSGWDLEDQMQTSSLGQGSMVNPKLEELAESVG